MAPKTVSRHFLSNYQKDLNSLRKIADGVQVKDPLAQRTPVWPDEEIMFTIFGRFLQWKYAQWPHKIPKVGSKIVQILNKPSKNFQTLRIWPKWQNFAESGHTREHSLTLFGELSLYDRPPVWPVWIWPNISKAVKQEVSRAVIHSLMSCPSNHHSAPHTTTVTNKLRILMWHEWDGRVALQKMKNYGCLQCS